MGNRFFRQKSIYFESSLGVLLTSFLGVNAIAHADVPFGILGGQNGSGNCVELLLDLSGTLSPVSGLSPTGLVVNSVGINASGLSLIGGADSSAAYAAFVGADGTASALDLAISSGQISSVAINKSGLGLIEGYDDNLSQAFVAYVSEDGSITPLSVFSFASVINDVALGDSGVGLIGGEGGGMLTPYAAYVSTDGTISVVPGLSGNAGHILAVAMNQEGVGLVGGYLLATQAYGAFVYPSGTPTPIELTSIPMGSGAQLNSVAINSSGTGLVGGSDASSNAYAGLAATDGTLTALITTPFSGIISSVALNDFGVGLIGGENNNNLYAALVQSDGSLIPLFNTSISGVINSVAINSQGVGLIGGQINGSDSYGALVAPNGTLTPLTLPGSQISSVSIVDAQSVINQVIPSSTGAYQSHIYSQLAVASALQTHIIQKNKVWKQTELSEGVNVGLRSIEYDNLQASLAMNPEVNAKPKVPTRKEKKNSLWMEPFGNLVYLQNNSGSIPNYSNEIGGILIGYDREEQNYIVGTTAGYAYNYVNYKHGLGHAQVQEEMLSVYGAYYASHFWMEATLWGGLYQSDNTRYFLSTLKAKSNTSGWIVDPHLELASPWSIDCKRRYYVEPFVQVDWVNSWQNHYTETGTSGFNLKMPSQYNSLLQSEAGLRFYEKFAFGWGEFCLEEKLSYINQAPFGDKTVSTSFVGSSSSFPVAVASSQVQNLGAGQILGCFVPKNTRYPYGGLSFQASVGSSYQSYFLSIFIGEDF